MSKIIVKKKHGIFTCAIDDIVYMEKDLRKIRLHTVDREMDFYGTFPEVVQFLDNRFMCCHRSYIINMDAIVWMKEQEIYVINNKSIHMGKDAYGRARKIFTEYLNQKYPEKTLKNPKFFL